MIVVSGTRGGEHLGAGMEARGPGGAPKLWPQSWRPKVRASQLLTDSSRPVPGSRLEPATEQQGTPPGYSVLLRPRTQPWLSLCVNSFFGERPEKNNGSVQPEVHGVREPGFPWQSFVLSQGQITQSPEPEPTPTWFLSFCR